jgi:hypothetical protein
MMAPSHMATGFIGGVGAARLYGATPHAQLIWGGVCAVFAIWPDGDHPNSTFSKALPPITTFLCICIRALSRAVYLATRTKKDRRSKGTHRMLTHTITWAVLSGAAVETVVACLHGNLTLGGWVALAAFWGSVIHCLGDDVTESGVPFWAPLIKIKGQRWHTVHLLPKWMRIKTGKGPERFIFRALLIPGCALIIPGVLPVVIEVISATWHGFHEYQQQQAR